jgi:multidrug transporter EmrE-like cation transporter
MIALLPVLVAIGFAAIGQLTMKYAMTGANVAVSDPVATFRYFLTTPMIYLGIAAYGASSFLWLISLSRLPLSYMYPFTALLIVVITFASAILFQEPLNAWKLSGVALIITGLLVIARG